ncbi:MAG: 1-acyl-sn-glycerol-3-phosphate acyltransferase [Mediterranea sp.]|jgi:putative hemolysin|nr:1-acyl-sn-glycerol-3-phosphate acyltransferase [Mediterranea sp.]
MKDKLIDKSLLIRISPLLKNAFLAKAMVKIAGLDKANRIYDAAKQFTGTAATDALLAEMGITCRTHHIEVLDRLAGRPFITVSNHPYGHIDGIALIGEIAKVRPDFKVMVNWILQQIDILEEFFIGVNPFTDGQFAVSSIGGVKACLEHLQGNHPLGLFPAGSVSKNVGHGKVHDRVWLPGVLKLIKQAAVPVVPVFISGNNSALFNFLDHFPWWVRNIRLCHELDNKHGQTIHLVFGDPIEPEVIREYDVQALGEFLQNATYGLVSDEE